MSENLDNLLVEAFSKNLFKGADEDIEDGEIDKEEGEIDSGDDNKEKQKKSKLKSKHKHKLLSKLKIKSRIESKSKLKKVSKSGSKLKPKTSLTSRIKAKTVPTVSPKTDSKTPSKASSKIRSKVSSKTSSKTISRISSKSKSKIDSKLKTKKSKSSVKSEKTDDKNNDENESEVMKLLLSKQLKSYADIQFKDEEDSPEREIPKKSKHKSSKKDEKHSDKSKRHKKSKNSDEYYEKQNDSYYETHSSASHEDYFYGSYYEGTEEYPSNRSRRRDYEYSRPLSPLYDSEWKHRSRSRSPIDYESKQSSHRRRSMSPTERYYSRRDRQRSVTPFFKDGVTNRRHHNYHRRSLSPGGRSCRSSSVASSRRSIDRVDKQKLLEIARNNLIKMIEKGDLPKGTDINNLKLKHLRELTTQKSVQQWTEFCRAISTLESGAYDSDDSDSDNDDIKSVASDQPFSIRHPFKLNERKDIQISIRGFPQLPSRSAKELAIELRETFPVSSGNQHRRKELEWHEVEPLALMPPPTMPAPKKAKKIETKLTEILNTPRSVPNDPQCAYKIIATTTTTTPTTPTTTITTSSDTQAITSIETITPTSTTESSPTSPSPVSAPTLSAEPILSTNSDSTAETPKVSESDSVFPQSSMPIDIGSVMAQRLNAMRKLQEEPHNVVALKQMFQANQMMTEWAESKIVPGQFIGSTGANILTPEQLNAGSYNAWTKKDQLKRAAPITGGIGMLLLLKMGWTPGKGLGKNNEGTINPIVLEIKTDKKGLVAEEEQVRNLPLQLVSTTPIGNAKYLSKPGKNPVSILHELCAKKKWNQPDYELVNEVGPDHRKNFTFKVMLNGVEYQPSVSSANKKQAKALAAGVALQAFGLLPKDNE